MGNTSLTDFRYMYPRMEHHLIPDSASYKSVDADTWSGGLRVFRGNTFNLNLDDEYSKRIPISFYRFYDGTRSQWLFFDSKTSVARSPVLDDQGNLCYITGIDDYPRVFSSDTLPPTATTIDSTNSYKAGISKPEAPLLATVTQANPGATSARTNSYRVAYLRTWDTYWNPGSGTSASGRTDLGPMSDVGMTSDSLTYVNVNNSTCATVTIAHDPNNEVEEHRTHVVIYRNDTTTDGGGNWREVIRFPLTTTGLPSGVTWVEGTGWVFTDTVATEQLGAIAENEDWTMPDGLQGLVSLHNGVIAGFVGNTVYLSVPYYGHAYPSSQTIITDFDVVGMGSFQNTLVICTKSNTYLCVCSDPTLPILTPVQEAQSCISADSIASLRDRVIYAAPYGLIQVDGNGSRQITEGIIGSFRWGDYNPPSIKAACYEGNYLFYFDSNIVPYKGAIYNVAEPTVGILGLSQKPLCIWHDDVSTNVFVILRNPTTGRPGVYTFGASYSPGRVFTWISKKFLRNQGLISPSVVKVNFLPEYTVIDNIPFVYEFSKACLNEPKVNIFPINGDANTWPYNISQYSSHQCNFTIYGDDEEWDSVLITSKDFYRVKSGRRFDSFYVKITSTIPIMKVQMATSAGELE